MKHNSLLTIIPITLILSLTSLFAVANPSQDIEITEIESHASQTEQPNVQDEMVNAVPDTEAQPLQSSTRSSVDYMATEQLLLKRYPYALMSYLSEIETIYTAENIDSEIFAIFRLSYLGSKNFELIVDEEAIPENWKQYFRGHVDKELVSGTSVHQMISQLTIPNSNIRIRLFRTTMSDGFASPDEFQGNKIVIAISGEKPNDALLCMVNNPKTSAQKGSSCSEAVQYLQDILDLVESIKEKYPEHAIEISGYSFSGAIAQIIMSMSDSIDQVYIFNSYGIHPSWLEKMSEEKLDRIHHSYIEGSYLYGKSYNLISVYFRSKLPDNKVIVPGMKISSDDMGSNIRHIYMSHRPGIQFETFYNYLTDIWILHSKESVLRSFEAKLKFDFPW